MYYVNYSYALAKRKLSLIALSSNDRNSAKEMTADCPPHDRVNEDTWESQYRYLGMAIM